MRWPPAAPATSADTSHQTCAPPDVTLPAPISAATAEQAARTDQRGRPRQTGAIRDPARRAAAPITEFAGIHPLPAVYLTLGYWSRRASLSAGEAR